MLTAQTQKDAARSSALISLVLVLMTLTFPVFFFALPFASGITVLGFLQVLSSVGWLLMVIVPPVLLSVVHNFTRLTRNIFLLSALVWPVFVLAIRVTLLVQTGNPYVLYLVQYPIFLFSDIFVPVIYIVMWTRLKV